MQRSGYTDAERAQCVLWRNEEHRTTHVQSPFQQRYHRSPPASSTIRKRCEDYESWGKDAHKEEMVGQESWQWCKIKW